MLTVGFGGGDQAQQLAGVLSGGGHDVVSSGLPRVIVPVLSSTMVLSLCAVSSASALLTSTPECSPLPVATMIDSGVARPRAHGQEMIRTLTAATITRVSAGPRTNQSTNVVIAMKMTAGTK